MVHSIGLGADGVGIDGTRNGIDENSIHSPEASRITFAVISKETLIADGFSHILAAIRSDNFLPLTRPTCPGLY